MDDNFSFFLLILDSEDAESNDDFFYSTNWVENIEKLSPIQYKETFRMNRETFGDLIHKIEKNFGKIKNLNRNLHLFIYYIAHVKTIRNISDLFGIPKSSVCRIVEEISGILYKFSTEEVKFPKPDEYNELIEGFKKRADNREKVILAIDGTHLEILKPSNNGFDYYNRKQYFSINTIVLTDYKLRFRAVTYSFGKNHDSYIIKGSSIYTQIKNLENGTKVVGDKGFRGLKNIIIPNDNDFQLENLDLKTQRVSIENAIGLFKNTFKRFSVRIYRGENKKSIQIFFSAVWLHNFMIDKN